MWPLPAGSKIIKSLQTYLSVGPLSLRVDSAVTLCVLASRLGLWRVPLEGTAELKTLVLCWHGDAEPWEALRVQVGLHACRHAVGALEPGPPATQEVTAGPPTPEPFSHTEYCMQKAYLKWFYFSYSTFLFEQACFQCIRNYSLRCDKSCWILWHMTHQCVQMSCLWTQWWVFTLLQVYTPPPLILLCCLMRCEVWLRFPLLPSSFLPHPTSHCHPWWLREAWGGGTALLTGASSHTALRVWEHVMPRTRSHAHHMCESDP